MGEALNARARGKIEELRRHMLEDDVLVIDKDAEEPEELWELEVALVRLCDEDTLWVVPAAQDWEHDMLDGVETIPGTLYADDEPFTPGSPMLSGYFQAAESGKWLRIEAGKAPLDTGVGRPDWKDELADFSAVAAQLQEAADTPEYRCLIEKYAIQGLADKALIGR